MSRKRLTILLTTMLPLLSGCTLAPGVLAGAVLGSALSPLLQPQVDRILHAAHLDPIDPGGTSAVKGTN